MMADLHICNDLASFQMFTLEYYTATTGDHGMEIHGYGDVLIAIKIGNKQLIQQFTLKNVAYTPKFHMNLVCAAKLHKIGIIIDQVSNRLQYNDDGGVFANLINHRDLYLLDTTVLPPKKP
ncbi:hypothetical protein DV735_g5982, partial [Chaetothyriales sp. CBS 134920]